MYIITYFIDNTLFPLFQNFQQNSWLLDVNSFLHESLDVAIFFKLSIKFNDYNVLA